MSTHIAPYPLSRPRRLRRDVFTRNLVREHHLTAHDLIYPVFVLEGDGRREPAAPMHGVERRSLELLLPVARECVELGTAVLALGSGKLDERGGRRLKLLSGAVMLALGLVMLLRPQWLV